MTGDDEPQPESGIGAYFHALQEQLRASLGLSAVLPHPVAKGDEAEGNWVQMLSAHLPYRYQVVAKCFVVDHDGGTSREVDVALCDRQYTTLILRSGSRLVVPAEAVYAVFEVKQRIDRDHVLYASQMVESVRSLKRTSAPIVHAGGVIEEPREPGHIIGGLLTTGVEWAEGLATSFRGAIADQPSDGRLDIGCAATAGAWEVDYPDGGETIHLSSPEQGLVHFYLRLLSRLQRVGTVSAMDFDVWSEFLFGAVDD